MTIDINHPLLDGADEGWAATEMRSDVVALTAELADFISRTVSTKTRPVIVTPAFSRMTEALWQLLSQVDGLWLVRTGTNEFYNARSGAQSTSIPHALEADLTKAPVATDFLSTPVLTRQRLSYTVMTRHRVSRQIRLGGVVDAIAQEHENFGPLRWGAWEPATAQWDRDAVTQYSRQRMPNRSFWPISGGQASDLVGSLGVVRTEEGLEETTRLSADVGVPHERAQLPLEQIAARTVEKAAGFGMPLIAFALTHVTSLGGCRSPHIQAPAEPLSLLLGPAAVRMLGVDVAVWLQNFEAKTLGSPRIPSVLFNLKGGGEGWHSVQKILSFPDPEKLATAMEIKPELAALLSQLSAQRREGDV